jgi:predicted enzyme related to lactoylglutathione lyase
MAGLPVGSFVWYELMTTDPEAAKGFYSKVVGWSTSAWEGADDPYTMWMVAGEAPIGGLMQLPEDVEAQGVPSHWLAYVCVDDVAQTMAQAEAAGGGILMGPMDIPEVGRIAVIRDPQGAVLSVYTPAGSPPGWEGDPQAGCMSWHELATTDHVGAFDFYAALFGWERTSSFDMGELGLYQMYGSGGKELGGMYDKPAEMPGPPHWLLYTLVSDLDASLEVVKELGGQVLNGPEEVPGGDRVAQCMDPQGAVFALHAKG